MWLLWLYRLLMLLFCSKQAISSKQSLRNFFFFFQNHLSLYMVISYRLLSFTLNRPFSPQLVYLSRIAAVSGEMILCLWEQYLGWWDSCSINQWGLREIRLFWDLGCVYLVWFHGKSQHFLCLFKRILNLTSSRGSMKMNWLLEKDRCRKKTLKMKEKFNSSGSSNQCLSWLMTWCMYVYSF